MTGPPYAGAVIDLDGTVYRGDRLVPGADAAIETLRSHGVPLVFLTNKAIYPRATYRDRLASMGVAVDDEEVFTSGSITAHYLASTHPDDAVFLVGEAPLADELRSHDLEITTDPESTDVLLVSMDREFDYETLTRACEALDDDTAFLATNPDRTCPTETGEIPDTAAMVAAIEAATDTPLDAYLGKPSRTAVETVAEAIDAPLTDCLMVGDRLETDIAMGTQTGMTTALVMTGVTDRATLDAADERPDHVLDSIADIERVL